MRETENGDSGTGKSYPMVQCRAMGTLVALSALCFGYLALWVTLGEGRLRLAMASEFEIHTEKDWGSPPAEGRKTFPGLRATLTLQMQYRKLCQL